MQHAQILLRPTPSTRYSLLLIGVAPVVSQLAGSAFNIWYNVINVHPLLSEGQRELFHWSILIYNTLLYAVGVTIWVRAVLSIRRPFQLTLAREPVPAGQLERAQRRVINLPWLGAGICLVGWLSCIPVFLWALSLSDEPLGHVRVHLPVSLAIGALISVPLALLMIEVLTQRRLFPHMFSHTRPYEIPGARTLSLRGRGLMLAVSSGVCPVVCLLLVMIPYTLESHHSEPGEKPQLQVAFPLFVSLFAIAFGLASAWLVGGLVTRPVDALRKAAHGVARGNLEQRIELRRADEFGMLIDGFNDMVAGLREKERLRETFGMHVGREAAKHILARDPGLGGVEQEITVLFLDIRGFTARCAKMTPTQAVEILNTFLTEMVDIIELNYSGMVNKFLGDGLMAVFGVAEAQSNHAEIAVGAAREMVVRLESLNTRMAKSGCEPLAIGIGIHTGPALVGVVGSRNRQEFTVIGDTVNTASRVESLTKALEQPILMTEATRRSLPDSIPIRALPPQRVKGKDEPIDVYGLEIVRSTTV